MKPFIKWAGGKSQLLPEIRNNYPKGLGEDINKYCEPFIGGGAVLFDILNNYKLKEILINDINKELVNVYVQIKTNHIFLIDKLKEMQTEFWTLSTEEKKIYFYDKRERFNFLELNKSIDVSIEKASLFIFLNKTCFNGLYRVNKSGKFNVPIGSYKKPIICDEENLTQIHLALQNVKITTGDYQKTIDFIDESTFVYIDPPYRPISVTASFTSYTEFDFNDQNQVELGGFVDKAHEKGAKVVISNSDPKNSNLDDEFFDDLYSNYNIYRVDAKRMINSKGSNRGQIKELLISNYKE